MKRQELLVAAIQNGTVIDHIPCERLFQVMSLLRLQEVPSSVTIGYHLKSGKMGTKSIIKIADRFFTDDELGQLSVVAPNVSLAIIHDYEVVEKKTVSMPEQLDGIIHCPNPKCISENEPMRSRFHYDSAHDTLKCHYCNTVIPRAEAHIKAE